jgi:four helix bundle protein
MKLEELQVYQIAMDTGEKVWGIVNKWDYFSKDTIGKQLVKAADSMAANLSEGYGSIFIKRTGSSVITAEDLFMKQRHGPGRHLIEV